MNERIKELAEQAEGTKKHVPAVWQFYDHELEKFAELIVRECASICELESQTYKYSFTSAKAQLAESTAKYCGTMIKKYFGVE